MTQFEHIFLCNNWDLFRQMLNINSGLVKEGAAKWIIVRRENLSIDAINLLSLKADVNGENEILQSNENRGYEFFRSHLNEMLVSVEQF
jgi:hypothetical protein